MKAKLQAGQEIDFLTRAEMAEVLRDHARDTAEVEPTTWRAALSGKTDGTGAVTIDVLTVPMGRRFRLTRYIIQADGFTPAAPYQGTGFILVRREGGQVVDFLPLTAASGGGIPAKSADSTSAAAEFVNGEKVEIAIVGGPVTTGISVYAQGTLTPRAPSVVESIDT